MIKRHQEELRTLHHKLDQQTDTSLDRFKLTALVHIISSSFKHSHAIIHNILVSFGYPSMWSLMPPTLVFFRS